FFDKSLFRSFIQKLREMKLVWTGPDGKLDYDETLTAWEKDAKVVLGRELRHTIAKLSPETMSRMTGPGKALPPAADGGRGRRPAAAFRRPGRESAGSPAR